MKQSKLLVAGSSSEIWFCVRVPGSTFGRLVYRLPSTNDQQSLGVQLWCRARAAPVVNLDLIDPEFFAGFRNFDIL